MHESCGLKERLGFLADYTSYMLGCGATTSRCIRCAERIATVLDVDLEISYTFRHFTISCHCRHSDEVLTRVYAVKSLPISFERNSDLSALSWEAYDEGLSLEEMRRRFDRLTSKPRIDPLFTLILVGLANACFCRLFGGDPTAMAIVFTSTLVGFALRQRMTALGVNHYAVFTSAAFVASLCATLSLQFDCTAQIAIATSPLFLVPGVPLINGVIDIVDGHTLVGFSRLVNAMLLVLCLAIGLSATLLIVKSSLL